MYVTGKSLCYMPEMSIILHANYYSIKSISTELTFNETNTLPMAQRSIKKRIPAEPKFNRLEWFPISARGTQLCSQPVFHWKHLSFFRFGWTRCPVSMAFWWILNSCDEADLQLAFFFFCKWEHTLASFLHPTQKPGVKKYHLTTCVKWQMLWNRSSLQIWLTGVTIY